MNKLSRVSLQNLYLCFIRVSSGGWFWKLHCLSRWRNGDVIALGSAINLLIRCADPIIMYSLLTVFKLRRLAFNQSFNPDKSLLILFSIMATSESPEAILVSSACLLGIVYDSQPGKSFIKRRKRSGPSIEPCGTPHLMVRALDKTPLSCRHLIIIIIIMNLYCADINISIFKCALQAVYT